MSAEPVPGGLEGRTTAPKPAAPPTLELPVLSLQEMPDVELVYAHREGNAQAFAEIYRRYYSLVLGSTINHYENREIAEEITQMVFIKFFTRMNNLHLRTGRSVSGYLYKVMMSLILTQRRKDAFRKTDTNEQLYHPHQEERFAAEYDLIEEVGFHELEHMMTIILEKCTPKEQALAMLLIQEESYESMATTLGLNLNTLKTRVKRLREKMQGWRNEIERPRSFSANGTIH